MVYNPEIHHRRSIRLKKFDYSRTGYYYITICTHDRDSVFGDIIDGTVVLNEYGKIIENCWFDLPNHYHNVELNEFVIMPNHFHGIIGITVGAGLKPARTETAEPARTETAEPARTETAEPARTETAEPARTETAEPARTETAEPARTDGMNASDMAKRHGLPEIVRALKTFSSRQINEIRKTQGIPVWQRNYYEHVIRDDRDLFNIRQYIHNNPKNWEEDENYKAVKYG